MSKYKRQCLLEELTFYIYYKQRKFLCLAVKILQYGICLGRKSKLLKWHSDNVDCVKIIYSVYKIDDIMKWLYRHTCLPKEAVRKGPFTLLFEFFHYSLFLDRPVLEVPFRLSLRHYFNIQGVPHRPWVPRRTLE